MVRVTKAYYVDQTDKAVLIEQEGQRIWLPRSVIGTISKRARVSGQPYQECTFDVQKWWADSKGLDYE